MNIAVEGFEVEFHFAEMFGLKFVNLQVEGHKALQCAVVEQEVEAEVLAADLQEVLLADEGEVAAQFNEEAFEIGDEGVLEVRFGMGFRQVEKVHEVGVFEDAGSVRVQLCQRC